MIGSSIDSFGDQLPTGLDVVKLYCNEWDSRKAQSEIITWVVESIIAKWNLAGIPVRANSSIRLKVKNLLDSFKSILSTRRRSTEIQVTKETDFLEKNLVLFDIVNTKLETELCGTKKAFLCDQRTVRNQHLSALNLSRDNPESFDGNITDNSNASQDSIGTCSDSENDCDYSPSSSSDLEDSNPKKKLKLSTIQAMDNAGLSFRQMTQVSHAFINEFGEKPSEYCLGVSTFHSNSIRIRRMIVEKMSEDMKKSNSKLVLLFDTKTFTQLNAAHLPRGKRLAIVLYSCKVHYGLGLNPIENGSAETLSDQLQSNTIELNLKNRIVGLVCDTENTNTGYFGGTCIKFELKIQKELLRLCCRHHILEIVLKKVCYGLLDPNETPNFGFRGFDQLKIRWNQLDKTDFQPLDFDDDSAILSALRQEAISQIERDAKQPGLRDDYAEINDITLKLLGIRTNKSVRVIGASGKARWIAKVILIGKTFLFRHQLDLEPHIYDALKRICIFTSILYVKYWNRAASVVDAPYNDLMFMQQLHLYESYDEEVAQIAINSFREHLWYLGGELITLSIFSDVVPHSTKNRMRHRIQSNVTSRDELSLRYTISDNSLPFPELCLEDFVQTRSNFLFQVLEVEPELLLQDASMWNFIPSYKTIKNIVEQTIIVVNDGAERILGMADRSVKAQKARKEKNFQNLIFSKFDRNVRNLNGK